MLGEDPIASITDTNFSNDVLTSDQLVLVDFWAVWC
ncbi:MAG: thiol reductase thioredoxin, partial [Candidatus Melainabacteria bacterium]|nr:thiol reductase thioredoxin [Candidatus Melainabacteria bacterium]